MLIAAIVAETRAAFESTLAVASASARTSPDQGLAFKGPKPGCLAESAREKATLRGSISENLG
jgi:hypothetical protein